MEGNDRVYRFVVSRVVNGDTVEGIVDLGFGISSKQRFRLDGVVAPSLRSEDPATRERAKASKMWLQYRLIKQQVIVKIRETPKFGHYLATLFIEGSDVNQELFTSGHVVKFNKKENNNETE